VIKLLPLLFLSSILAAQQWTSLLNGKNLDLWETHGPCHFTVLPDGSILGQRVHDDVSNPVGKWPLDSVEYRHWLYQQAWLYTKAEYGQFDLHLEYWIPSGANSGVSIRDTSRAKYATYEAPVPAGLKDTTPAHIGYEIQIIDGEKEKYQTGSIYTFVAAPKGIQRAGEWNSLDIESRNDRSAIRLNGSPVAEYPGEPGRPLTGPIGLQLHDQFTFAMFRNIRIREIMR
jgi:hypothetical protein